MLVKFHQTSHTFEATTINEGQYLTSNKSKSLLHYSVRTMQIIFPKECSVLLFVLAPQVCFRSIYTLHSILCLQNLCWPRSAIITSSEKPQSFCLRIISKLSSKCLSKECPINLYSQLIEDSLHCSCVWIESLSSCKQRCLSITRWYNQ